MRERPIPFKAPMVLALLDGRKTQTRRVMKPQPLTVTGSGSRIYRDEDFKKSWADFPGTHQGSGLVDCPYGAPGDRLWVRETWQAWSRVSVEYDEWEAWTTEERNGRSFDEYRADRGGPDSIEYRATSDSTGPWTPSIHMPRWASRLLLEVTDVRVERLQEISAADAIAEGLSWVSPTYGIRGMAKTWDADPRVSYAALWESINGAAAWAANPWVWVVSFKRAEAPHA